MGTMVPKGATLGNPGYYKLLLESPKQCIKIMAFHSCVILSHYSEICLYMEGPLSYCHGDSCLLFGQ